MRDWCSECKFENFGGSQEPCYNCVTTYNKKPSEFTPATDEVRDYAELIAGLRDCAKHTCCSAPPATSLAADAIEELLAAVPKWNPASKPPKEKGDYWCNVRSYNFDDTYYQHEVWFDGECFVIDGVCTDRVTHWMPLPEPPKEVER